MKHIIYNIAGISLSAILAMSATSCNDYLDRDPSLDVSETVAFENYKNFQGFVEEVFNCIPNKESCFWCTTFNWGDDEIMNDGAGNTHMTYHMDIGDYRHWMNNAQNYLGGNPVNPTSGNGFDHRVYDHAWYCIRKCNQGIDAIENRKLFVGTKEEKQILLGELYFYRAWWHNEVMMYFGGIPYITKVYNDGDEMREPRLSYQECARKAADDFKKAASLLPLDWEQTAVGALDPGKNQMRVTRTAALGYAGKCLLWSASPLMENNSQGVEIAGDLTYKYNQALAAEAAGLLGTALTEVEKGLTPYALCDFDYSNIYYHERTKGVTNNYTDIFYTTGQGWRNPGATESIFGGRMTGQNVTPWNFAKLWGSKINSLVEHDKIIHMPTANYVNYAYGMANGLPIDDPESGFDPTHPFKDRDPRFYHDIVFDGVRVVKKNIDDNAVTRSQQYADFQTGSELRNVEMASRTGYFCQKLNSTQNNMFDGMYNWGGALQCDLPYMRLAEVYLLYAEACAAAGVEKAGGCSLSAKDAINVLRDRVGAGHIDESLTGNALMDEIRRERACELAFEGFRWNDLQRWLLLTEKPYNIKTAQEFTRVGSFDFVKNDPAEAQVAGWSERVIVERDYKVKHYLLPFKNADVTIYEGFTQNPGW